MSKTRDRRDPDEAMQRQKEQMDRKMENQQHLSNLQFEEDGRLSREFIESMTDTSELQGNTVKLLQNYLTRTWILSNMTEAEVHEMKWNMEAVKLEIRALHPPEGSVVTGDVRAFLLDDATANLEPLSDREKDVLDSIINTIKHAIIPRARDGFERKQLNTQVRESRTRRTDEEQDQSGWGLLGR